MPLKSGTSKAVFSADLKSSVVSFLSLCAFSFSQSIDILMASRMAVPPREYPDRVAHDAALVTAIDTLRQSPIDDLVLEQLELVDDGADGGGIGRPLEGLLQGPLVAVVADEPE